MLNPFTNKKVLNFHHADFDGAISGSCIKACMPNVTSESVGISKVGNKVLQNINNNNFDIILLTDININKETLPKCLDEILKNRLIIYDHHLHELNKILFSELNETYSVLDENVCGATISWYKMMEYFPNNTLLEDLEEIVYLSDVYDMWRLDNKDFEYAAKINNLLDYHIGYSPDAFRERFLKNPNPYKLSKKEMKILDIKQKRNDKDLVKLEENAFLFEYNDLIVVMTESNANDYTKMLFMNEVLSTENVDMFIFKYENTSQCSVRIPEKSSISDLNELFEDFGCAGHAKAGGIGGENIHRLEKILESI